jgi:hypothetical protein
MVSIALKGPCSIYLLKQFRKLAMLSVRRLEVINVAISCPVELVTSKLLMVKVQQPQPR